MAVIQKLFTSRKQLANAAVYVGELDRLWYDKNSNTLRVSDGETPGGFAISSQTSISTDANNIITIGSDGGLFANNSGSSASIKGTAILNFGPGSSTAQISVTGVATITANSFVQCAVRVQATDQHSVDDLLYDPIQVSVSQLSTGSGFTIHGYMSNAQANGTYIVNWMVA